MDTFLSSCKDDILRLRVLASLVVIFYWSINQLDINNVFLSDILDEEVYMKQPSGFVAQGECVEVLQVDEISTI